MKEYCVSILPMFLVYRTYLKNENIIRIIYNVNLVTHITNFSSSMSEDSKANAITF